ncbi:TraR/DksA family transcriptional regulator [Thiohalomonas denitrificans]|uniref:TraR/DksA family transcriptional regulator n=1 Tax=Thiohalomonas denitrificans TaxID=415747 RepID=UPI0026ECD3C0|nr:TraR/DksA C4-type zinc finger protein [Thiohalomonas denitrificans]
MDHLSEEQRRALRHRLQERHQQLRDQIREELLRADRERYSDLAGQVHDPGEESVADLLSDVNNSIVDNYLRDLRHVEIALERMNEGTYGICDECGIEIPFERLDAYPTAIRCIEDQEIYEKLYRERRHRPSL